MLVGQVQSDLLFHGYALAKQQGSASRTGIKILLHVAKMAILKFLAKQVNRQKSVPNTFPDLSATSHAQISS